ncbi:MAG: membrane protein insertase YidC [Deltaproteobacteria bacterium]|nr:MAG: membrane protein insertase YidC [Deltaproteobacteria bacterium]
MVKRTVLAMVLSLLVLIGFQMYLEKVQKSMPGGEKKVEEVKTPQEGKVEEKPRETKKGLIRKSALNPEGEAEAQTIVVETPEYRATLTTAGGGFTRFDLKKYPDRPGKGASPVNVIGQGESPPYPYEIYTGDVQPPIPLNIIFTPSATEVRLEEGEVKTLSLSWKTKEGFEIERLYTFHGNSYVVEISTVYRNRSLYDIDLVPGLELSQVYIGPLAGDKYSFKGLVAKLGNDVKRFSPDKLFKGKGPKTFVNWIALDSKYFTLGCIPGEPARVEKVAPVGDDGLRLVFLTDRKILKPGESYTLKTTCYLGPKESGALKMAGDGFTAVLDYGFFGWIAKPLVVLLKYSNKVTGNYGIDIILLTILIKILFYPMTHKSYISMKKMQDLQPIIKKLQEKYKDDKNRLNQEVMNLYKTYKINPLSGCMPLILQIPVFFALYKALLVAIELRHAPFMLWINDLSAPEHLIDFNVFGFVIPFRLLPLLMGISMFLQQKMSPSGGMDPTQKKLMDFLPLIFTVMFWGFPSGLVLYWLVNNIISIGQQYFIQKAAKKVKMPSQA